MELNVKQSGIERRIHSTTYYKTRSEKIHKRVKEIYLRNDVPCGIKICGKCKFFSQLKGIDFCENSGKTNAVPYKHVLLLDWDVIFKFVDVLNDPIFSNIIVLQSTWNYLKKVHSNVYKRFNNVYQTCTERFCVYLNEFAGEVFLDSHNIPELYQERCLIKCGLFLKRHWTDLNIAPVIICTSDDNVNRICGQSDEIKALTLLNYIKGISDSHPLVERLNDLNKQELRGKALFPDYYSQDQLLDGLSSGAFKKGKFMVSTENYLEADVVFDLDSQWFVQGRKNMNRAIHGDVVVAELLDENEWSCPEKTIRLRDADEEMKSNEMAPEGEDDTDVADEDNMPSCKRRKKDVVPTARIVGILRRNWRDYCGIIMPPNLPGGRQFLFAPAERLIPRIRIETSQYEQLKGKKVLVQIDNWPQDSHYPRGHYIKVIGTEGERETEDEVILLEHEIPHEIFSQSVLDCLPRMPWIPEQSTTRRDLTDRDICSIDPEGCTDIDDALHCIDLGNGTFEVGVHIADVTHFVRPDTALDRAASERSTSVYLCGRRIDMLPDLLSSNLCSLQPYELRYAFSVIWVLDIEAKIQRTEFCKSLIKSRRKFTYQEAQNLIDDCKSEDPLATPLRNLLNLSRLLKSRRKLVGALELASSEIRFEMDSDRNPKKVEAKKHLSTMSLIEEFMLLANISVAERILQVYPDCAILRRHPTPTRLSFKPLLAIAEGCGFQLSVDTGKELAKSLDEITAKCGGAEASEENRMVSRMIRTMATRCMTQAVYFAAGTVPPDQYYHYGLATNVYTHFTSPIRRYADIMVHRLLAALIGVDSIHPVMTDRRKLIRLTENMNKRHRKAQYASRASILLNTFLMIKECPEQSVPAIVIGIRNNGIQVLVPKYGLESVVYLKDKEKGHTTSSSEHVWEVCKKHGIKIFHEITVGLSVVERNQRRRIEVKLVEPFIEGISYVTDCDNNLPISETPNDKY